MTVAEVVTVNGRSRYVVVDNHGDLVEPIARYLKYLDLCGKARNTLRTYAGSLAFYFTFLRQKGLAYERVQIADLAAFVHWLKRTDSLKGAVCPTQIRSNRTINLHLGVVSGFYEYAWRTDQIDRDLNEKLRGQARGSYRPYNAFLHHLGTTPVQRNVLKQPTDRRRGPQTLTTTQIEQVLETCKTPRDRLIVHMLFETGLRPGELLALWLEDVRISPPQLQVVDRGELVNDAEIKRPASERTIDVSRDLINRVLDYVSATHTEAVETNHLLLKQHGKRMGAPMDYGDLHAVFTRLKRRTGIGFSPYTLRHTSLTNLARAGWAPEHLQDRAGHAQFQTTYTFYVHPTDEDLRNAWEQTQEAVRVAVAAEAI
jgi:site-specific recombinase XerD